MVEIEVFYYTSLSSIRQEQAEYLKKQKRQPFELALPVVNEISAEEYAKLKLFQRWRYLRMIRKQRKRYKKALRAQKMPVDERLTRGYNAGVEMALKVLSAEYREYMKRLKENE